MTVLRKLIYGKKKSITDQEDIFFKNFKYSLIYVFAYTFYRLNMTFMGWVVIILKGNSLYYSLKISFNTFVYDNFMSIINSLILCTKQTPSIVVDVLGASGGVMVSKLD